MRKILAVRVALLLLSVSAVGLSARERQDHREFYATEPSESYGRTRAFDLQHVRIDVDLDLKGKKLTGVSTMTFAPLRSDAEALDLDACDLEIDAVALDGESVKFERSETGLRIHVSPARKLDETFHVAVRYHGSPKKGMYFIAPDAGYPKRPYQAWTQGESEDTRYWVPIYDFPNDKATTETVVTVDDEFTVFSNGEKIDVSKRSGRATYHYRLDVPHVTYLLSIVAGKFDVAEEMYGKVPLRYVVAPGWGARANDIFKNTPKMMAYYEKVTGEPYPYPAYSQIVTHDFTAGGMENTTATTLNDFVLYPANVREEYAQRVDNLLAHELAHQWFGDLVTCETWNHLWLNEGFATYFASLAMGELYGPDYFQHEMDRDRIDVLSAPPRPTVDFRFVHSEDTFDDQIYARGAWILHMLRRKLGDELFWRGLKNYVKEFREKTVDTEDFRRAMERATGADLKEFFAKWAYRAGFLNLTASWSWDADMGAAILTMDQKPVQGTTDVYYNPEIVVEVEGSSGPLRKTFSIDQPKTKAIFPLGEKPKAVRIDPDGDWLAKIEFKREDEELVLNTDPKRSVPVRYDAVRNLASHRTQKSIEALGKVLRSDPFFSVRFLAATSLGQIGLPESWNELLQSLDQPMPQVRAEIVASLSRDARESTVSRLEQILSNDKSELVAAKAAYMLASLRRARSLKALKKAATRSSLQDRILAQLLQGFGAGGWKEGLDLARKVSAYGQPKQARPSAIRAIGQIGKFDEDRRDHLELLERYVDDPAINARRAALDALGRLGEAAAENLLERMASDDPDGGVRRSARDALKYLREGKGSASDIKAARKDLGEIRQKQEELLRRVEFLEKRPAFTPKPTATPKKEEEKK